MHSLTSKQGKGWIQTVRTYYRYIDAKDLTSLYQLFTDDIVYLRAGTPPIIGMKQFRNFYEEGRIILSGKHKKLAFEVKKKSFHTSGVFVGVLKNGDEVDVAFSEIFYFDKQGKISKRITRFPARARRI